MSTRLRYATPITRRPFRRRLRGTMTDLNRTAPTTRPPLERLIRLRETLRAGGANAPELAERLEVCERTIRRDVEFARDRLDWPVVYDARRRRFVLDGDLPSLPAVTMPPEELIAVLVAARAMECYRGTPYAAALQSGFQRILSALDAPVKVTLPIDEALPRFSLDPTREVQPELYAQLSS